jgi:hypothetical protein
MFAVMMLRRASQNLLGSLLMGAALLPIGCRRHDAAELSVQVGFPEHTTSDERSVMRATLGVALGISLVSDDGVNALYRDKQPSVLVSGDALEVGVRRTSFLREFEITMPEGDAAVLPTALLDWELALARIELWQSGGVDPKDVTAQVHVDQLALTRLQGIEEQLEEAAREQPSEEATISAQDVRAQIERLQRKLNELQIPPKSNPAATSSHDGHEAHVVGSS